MMDLYLYNYTLQSNLFIYKYESEIKNERVRRIIYHLIFADNVFI